MQPVSQPCPGISARLITLEPHDLACPDSILRQPSQPAEVPSKTTEALVAFLKETLHHIDYAAGISAIQIGVPLQVAIVNIGRVPGNEIILINPVLLSASGRLVKRSEGCLSLPNLKGTVSRRNKIQVETLDLQGNRFILASHGYEAAVVQHELDHLSGIFYWDRMPPGIVPTWLHATEPAVHGDTRSAAAPQ